MSTGRKALTKVVLEQISQIELYQNRISELCSWDTVSTKLLLLAISGELVDIELLYEAIHERLLVLAGEAYKQHIQAGTLPYHITSPHAFAYGIRHDVFSQRELSLIKFDHGDNVATFMEGKVTKLVEEILHQLIEKT